MTADEDVDVIAELVRRTTAAQGLPAELEDVSVAQRVAVLLANEARRTHDEEGAA